MYGHIVAWLSEYVGTTFFFLLALAGEQVAWTAYDDDQMPAPDAVRALYSSLCIGCAFAISSWAFFRITLGL